MNPAAWPLLLVATCAAAATAVPPPGEGPARADDADDVAFCASACAAGLGAPRCGDGASLCRPALLANASVAQAHGQARGAGLARRGKPRGELCPQLCPLSLGDPLCRCKGLRQAGSAPTPDWRAKACEAVCKASGKAPAGCPPCATETAAVALGVRDIDWDWWCHILCLEGDGGLACLCDINP